MPGLIFGQGARSPAAGAVLAAIILLAGCSRAPGQGSAGAAAPAPAAGADASAQAPAASGTEVDAKLDACLDKKAEAAREAAAPIDSIAQGLLAQCHVEIDWANGRTMAPSETATGPDRQAIDQAELAHAKAAIAKARGGAGS